MRKLFITLFAVAVMAASPLMAVAQDASPTPGATAKKTLPTAKALGAGWSMQPVVSPDVLSPYVFSMSPDVFSEGAAAVYLGPKGAQVIFVSLVVTSARVAIRQSWDDAAKIVQSVSLLGSADYGSSDDLASMDPPKGCSEADRSTATEQLVGLPIGTTQCAVDPDGILIAIVVGDVNGKTGVDASDAVIEAALSADK